MGERTLGQLNKHVVISAFRLDGGPEALGRATLFPVGKWRPCLFSNLPLGNGAVPPDMDLSCADAAMRTSAAPSYFPIYQGYVDGAVYANNPTIPALARVCSHFAPRVTLDNVIVLSLGCGMIKQFIPREDCDAARLGSGALVAASARPADGQRRHGRRPARVADAGRALYALRSATARAVCDSTTYDQGGPVWPTFAVAGRLVATCSRGSRRRASSRAPSQQEASVNNEPLPPKEPISSSASSSSSRRSGRRF
jgi:hypothetical protein